MPENADIEAVYDIEGIIEKALVLFFKDQMVNAITSQQAARTGDAAADTALEAAGYTLIDFQQPRPRVEITFVLGAGADQFAPQTIAGVEMPMETSWNGQLRLDLITLPEVRLHAAYRTKIRYLIHSQLRSLNGNQLTAHKIQEFYKDAGTTPRMKAEDGSFLTTMLFDLNVSIQNDAWASLG